MFVFRGIRYFCKSIKGGVLEGGWIMLEIVRVSLREFGIYRASAKI